MTSTSPLKAGDTAPDFTLGNQKGESVALAGFRGRKAVILFFYPKDDTLICTAEACSFRDSYEDFLEAGAEVIGISDDPAESHEKFAQKHRLPFILLSDEAGKVRKRYGVTAQWGLLPGRVTFVIDSKGVILEIFDSRFKARKHMETALAAIRRQR